MKSEVQLVRCHGCSVTSDCNLRSRQRLGRVGTRGSCGLEPEGWFQQTWQGWRCSRGGAGHTARTVRPGRVRLRHRTAQGGATVAAWLPLFVSLFLYIFSSPSSLYFILSLSSFLYFFPFLLSFSYFLSVLLFFPPSSSSLSSLLPFFISCLSYLLIT
jgi:hypothetical protein